jgi:hypothetical protein
VDRPGNRTPISWMQTRRHPVRPAAHPSVGMAGFEPAISCSQSRRINQALPHPGSSAWPVSNRLIRSGKAVGYCPITVSVLPRRIVEVDQSTGWDSNPRFRITGAESSPLDDQCLSNLVNEGTTFGAARASDTPGQEPGTLPETWSRERESCRLVRVGPEGVEPSSSGYRPDALPLSYGPHSYAFEP